MTYTKKNMMRCGIREVNNMEYGNKVLSMYNSYVNNGGEKKLTHWLYNEYPKEVIGKVKCCGGEYNDLKKTFTSDNGKVSISREDYLDFGCPLDPTHTSDEDMQEMVNAIDLELAYMCGKDYVLDFDVDDRVRENFWVVLEQAGIHWGMIYCEDFSEEE